MKKKFKLDAISKVEGHAKLTVEMSGNKVKTSNLEIYEASRYFEAMVRGKNCKEVHKISQRICGICSVVHTVTALRAIENALGVKPSKQTTDLRKILMYASQVHSHTAHLFFFALPDYMGVSDAIEMSKKNKDHVHLAFDLQRVSSDIVKLIGGRAIHPVTPKVGGFYSVPDKEKMQEILEKTTEMKKLVTKAANIFVKIKIPEMERKTVHFAMDNSEEYTLFGKEMTNMERFSFKPEDYSKHIKEEIGRHSNAKYAFFNKKSYMVGALPRININSEYLSKDAKKLLISTGFTPPIYNPFFNNIAQAIELVHFTDECIRIAKEYSNGMKEENQRIRIKEGEGVAACEAPRGILIHHYKIGKDGNITKANIITPTSQNAASMEDDIKSYLPMIIKHTDRKVKQLLEMILRAYDPCFSCSVHFLELKLKR
ncbi:MAG: Ni/Fe hydrogenase subunit alpha [Candidatus Aenigmarchaeota archaeon]|nr:Ni/Fe hydrogenase subunit alpha [Candidatus Aenigmarchaeota archaeon]